MHNVNVKINKRRNEYINNKVSLEWKHNETEENRACRQLLQWILIILKRNANNKRQTQVTTATSHSPRVRAHKHAFITKMHSRKCSNKLENVKQQWQQVICAATHIFCLLLLLLFEKVFNVQQTHLFTHKH